MLAWNLRFWPDALPSLLAEGIASKNGLLATVEELLVADIASSWSAAESRRPPADYTEQLQQRHLLQGGGSDGLLRLFYGWNPLLPCRVPAMATAWIVSMADLMQFLEGAAKTAGDNLIDLHLSAFIAARADRKFEMQVNGLAGARTPGRSGWANSCCCRICRRGTILRRCQHWRNGWRPGCGRIWSDGATGRAAKRCRRGSTCWRRQGFVARLLELTEDTTARALDIGGAYRAANEVARIDAEVAAIDSNDKARFANAERFGQVIAGGIGLSALILMVMSVLLR